jgi:molecular chaperone GrpE (heat shock protein)
MDAYTSSTKISAVERERMVRNFAAWLDRALKDEELPEGLPPELLAALQNGEPFPPLEGTHAAGQGSDLYSLWSSMTTLAQEVRVQGRLFKQLNDTLIQDMQNRTVQREEETAQDLVRGDRNRQAEGKQQIDLLLELRDRMERGVATACDAAAELAPARLPRLARWLGVGSGYARHAQQILSALSHGYSLSLDRLDEALVSCGIDRIACLGRIFDPQRMTAVDVDETGTVPEGTVIEVYRDGYEWNGTVYRTAQVKVARNMRSKVR